MKMEFIVTEFIDYLTRYLEILIIESCMSIFFFLFINYLCQNNFNLNRSAEKIIYHFN